MTHAIIDQNNIVENIIVWDGVTPWSPPEGSKIVKYEGEVHIGWKWNGTNFADPNPKPLPPVPTNIEQSGPKVVA